MKGNYTLEKMFLYTEHFKYIVLAWQRSGPSLEPLPHLGNLCSVSLLP